MENKKGAIELSVTTIIVIVLGVALLSLGLVFISNIFSKITKTTDDVFGDADILIEKIAQGTDKLSLPTSVVVKKGKSNTFKAFVFNDGSLGSGKREFEMVLLANQNENRIRAKIISPTTVDLDEGERAGFVIQIVATGDAPISSDSSYQVLVTSNGEPYDASGFSINVEETGFLGF